MKTIFLCLVITIIAHELFAVVPHEGPLQPLQEIELSASEFDKWTIPDFLVKVNQLDPDWEERELLLAAFHDNQCEVTHGATPFKTRTCNVNGVKVRQVMLSPVNFVDRESLSERTRTLTLDGVQWVKGNPDLVDKVTKINNLAQNEEPTSEVRKALWLALCTAIVSTPDLLPQIAGAAEKDLCKDVWLLNDLTNLNVRGVTVQPTKQQSAHSIDDAIPIFGNCKIRGGSKEQEMGGNAAYGLHTDNEDSGIKALRKRYQNTKGWYFYNVWIALDDITASPLGFGVDKLDKLEFRAMKAGDFVVFNSVKTWHVALPLVSNGGPNCRASAEFRFSYIPGRKPDPEVADGEKEKPQKSLDDILNI